LALSEGEWKNDEMHKQETGNTCFDASKCPGIIERSGAQNSVL